MLVSHKTPPPFSVLSGIPPAPNPDLDPYLDAAAECFARHGVQRASVQDVARRLGVNRTTVYRQIGNVEDMVRLGKDVEKRVLARGLRLHLEDRVIMHDNKTVLFD